MGIKIINGFDLNSPLPLDSRAVVENATEMNELITKNFVSIGQTCFNKADNKLYVLKANNETLEWSEVGGSIAATALTNEDLDTLKTEGSYYAGGNNTCTNKPTGIDAFGLTIKRVASGYYTQYLTGGNTNTGQVYTRTFTSGAWTSWVKFTQDTQLATKQDKLVSGTNIKTINGNSILGSGDLTISADKVFSIPIEQVITQEEIVDLYALMTNVEGSVKVVFGSLYDFGDVFNNYDCVCLNCSAITGGEKDKIILRKNIDLNESGSFSCTYAYMYNGDLGAFSIINVTISKSPKTLTAERISSTDLLPTPESDTKDGDVLIYDSKRTKYGQLSKWATLDFYKTISLFGNHSILVPKDSTDTNIDLYNHAIKISGSITSGETTTNLKVYTTITSSNNLEIDSITDLNTILGSSYEVMCSGFYGANSVISISKTAEGNPSFGYNNNGGESLISFSKFTNLVIKDTVKTV